MERTLFVRGSECRKIPQKWTLAEQQKKGTLAAKTSKQKGQQLFSPKRAKSRKHQRSSVFLAFVRKFAHRDVVLFWPPISANEFLTVIAKIKQVWDFFVVGFGELFLSLFCLWTHLAREFPPVFCNLYLHAFKSCVYINIDYCSRN
jgi:hypothetical protein